jgi:foldase protein PrsA
MKNTKETKNNKEKKDESTKKTSKRVCKIAQWYKGNKILALGGLFVMISFLSGYYLKGMIVAATVNGKPIWRFEVVKQLERYYGANVLDNLITQRLMEKEAQQNGIVVTEEEIDSAIKELEANLGNSGTNLDEALKESNMTREDLRKDYKTNIMIEKLLTSRVSVSEEEVQNYIDENEDTFPEDTDLEQVKTLVRDQLVQEKMSAEYQNLLQEIKEKAEVKSMVNYYTFN